MPTLWAGFTAGLCLFVYAWASVIRTLLVPGNAQSLLTRVLAWAVLMAFRVVCAPVSDLDRRERLLAAGPPVFLVVSLAGWIACLYAACALLLLPFTGGVPGTAPRLAGSSLFTLGFDVPHGAAAHVVAFAAAFSGPAVIALMIGYMPTLYSAYNRRETQVSTLGALSGTPPWGPELLARQILIGNTGYMARLYERWTEWSADVAESHTTYRTLIYFRSRNPRQPWPLALLAMLDAAALHLALCPGSAPAEARPLLRVGFTCMRELAAVLGVRVNDDPRPDDPLTLSREVRRGGRAPDGARLGVRADAGGGVAAFPRVARELRDGCGEHRRASGPGARALVGDPGASRGGRGAPGPSGGPGAWLSRGAATGGAGRRSATRRRA